MATQRQPDAQDIEALVAFLPRLYGDDAPPLVRWKEAEKNDDGILVYSPAECDEIVEEFMELVTTQNWIDPCYDREKAGKLLGNEAAIRTATIPEIQGMLTFIVRGERFVGNFLADVFESGEIRQILERLSVILREWSMGKHPSGEQ